MNIEHVDNSYTVEKHNLDIIRCQQDDGYVLKCSVTTFCRNFSLELRAFLESDVAEMAGHYFRHDQLSIKGIETIEAL